MPGTVFNRSAYLEKFARYIEDNMLTVIFFQLQTYEFGLCSIVIEFGRRSYVKDVREAKWIIVLAHSSTGVGIGIETVDDRIIDFGRHQNNSGLDEGLD